MPGAAPRGKGQRARPRPRIFRGENTQLYVGATLDSKVIVAPFLKLLGPLPRRPLDSERERTLLERLGLRPSAPVDGAWRAVLYGTVALGFVLVEEWSHTPSQFHEPFDSYSHEVHTVGCRPRATLSVSYSRGETFTQTTDWGAVVPSEVGHASWQTDDESWAQVFEHYLGAAWSTPLPRQITAPRRARRAPGTTRARPRRGPAGSPVSRRPAR